MIPGLGDVLIFLSCASLSLTRNRAVLHCQTNDSAVLEHNFDTLHYAGCQRTTVMIELLTTDSSETVFLRGPRLRVQVRQGRLRTGRN